MMWAVHFSGFQQSCHFHSAKLVVNLYTTLWTVIPVLQPALFPVMTLDLQCGVHSFVWLTAGEDPLVSDQQHYRYMTVDDMKSLGDDSLQIDVTRDERAESNRVSMGKDLKLSLFYRTDFYFPVAIYWASKQYVVSTLPVL